MSLAGDFNVRTNFKNNDKNNVRGIDKNSFKNNYKNNFKNNYKNNFKNNFKGSGQECPLHMDGRGLSAGGVAGEVASALGEESPGFAVVFVFVAVLFEGGDGEDGDGDFDGGLENDGGGD